MYLLEAIVEERKSDFELELRLQFESRPEFKLQTSDKRQGIRDVLYRLKFEPQLELELKFNRDHQVASCKCKYITREESKLLVPYFLLSTFDWHLDHLVAVWQVDWRT